MNWIEVIGVLAVVISLLFVAYQIRQANRIATGAATIELQHMALVVVNTFLNEPELADLGAKLATNDQSLTPKEIQLSMAYGQQYYVLWDAIEAAYENSLISSRTYSIYDGQAEDLIRRWTGVIPYMLNILESWEVTPANYKKSGIFPKNSIHATFLDRVVSLGLWKPYS
jgi:hypothetical protein